MFIEGIKEEFDKLIHKKVYIVVLFIIPILTTILMGNILSHEVITDIPLAVIDYDNSTFSRQLVDSFDQNDTFNVTYYPSSTEELEKLIQNSEVRVGMIIPENFYDDVVALNSPTVLMIYDGSHMSITSVAKSKAVEIILTYKAGATISQLQARLGLSFEEAYNIAQAFQFKTRVLYNPTKSFENFLAPILLAGIIQAAIVMTATQSINFDIYDEDRKRRFGYAAGKVLFYTVFGTLSYMISIIIQVRAFDMPFVGSMFNMLILSAALSFAVSAFCVLMSTVMKNRIIALVGGALVFIPNSIMAGTTWPLKSMPVGYQGFAKYIPFTHYVNNMRNVYFKELTLQELSGDIWYMILFGIIVILVSELVIFVGENEDKELVNSELSKDVQDTIPLNL